tara:strand:- start:121 stop:279 length:159 start_codon:yes stop_codon:yes gene_type:complete
MVKDGKSGTPVLSPSPKKPVLPVLSPFLIGVPLIRTKTGNYFLFGLMAWGDF